MHKFVVSADPLRCRMWTHHDRLEEYVNEVTCRAELESFKKHGQLIPVIGRTCRDDESIDYELICGARRLFVARYLNAKLLVDVRELSDKDAIIAMDIENRVRKDVSPYERGLSYTRSLRANHFKSQEELARALRVSASQVSRLVKIARLPSVIVSAFANPLDIREGWGIELIDAWENPEMKGVLASRARALSMWSPKPSASETFAQLMASGPHRRPSPPQRRNEVILDTKRRPLFRIRTQQRAVCIVLPKHAATPPVMDGIRQALSDIMQRTTLTVKNEESDAPVPVDWSRPQDNCASDIHLPPNVTSIT